MMMRSVIQCIILSKKNLEIREEQTEEQLLPGRLVV